jgi:hypothetical protein
MFLKASRHELRTAALVMPTNSLPLMIAEYPLHRNNRCDV